MSTHSNIVMGPAGLEVPNNSLAPPVLSTVSDKLTWREEVREWAQNVDACARAGDSRAKGVAATLAHTLYRSLSKDKKEVVKRSLRNGELVLTPSTDIDKSNQLELVEILIRIVAKDTTVEAVRRISTLNKRINGCVRKSGESITSHVARFTAIAQTYLNLTHASEDTAESQNFAMTLLANSKISQQTFSAIVATLVSSSREKNLDNSGEIRLSINRATTVLQALEALKDSTKEKPADADITACINIINAAIDFVKDGDHGEKVHISLSDAVSALEDTAMEDKDLNDGDDVKKPEAKSGAMVAHNQNGYHNRKFGKNNHNNGQFGNNGYQRRQYGSHNSEQKQNEPSSSGKQENKGVDHSGEASTNEIKAQLEDLRRIIERKRGEPEDRDPKRKRFEENKNGDREGSGQKPRQFFH